MKKDEEGKKATRKKDGKEKRSREINGRIEVALEVDLVKGTKSGDDISVGHLEMAIILVETKSSESILRGRVSGHLNVSVQKMSRQELETEKTLVSQMEQLGSINDLGLGDNDVDDPEIVVKSMSHKATSTINQETKFEICRFQGCHVMS